MTVVVYMKYLLSNNIRVEGHSARSFSFVFLRRDDAILCRRNRLVFGVHAGNHVVDHCSMSMMNLVVVNPGVFCVP